MWEGMDEFMNTMTLNIIYYIDLFNIKHYKDRNVMYSI